MTSYTLSFNKLLIINAIVLVLLAELIVSFVYPVSSGRVNYALRDRINKEKPDIVLIGGSSMSQAISEQKLRQELKLTSNKEYKVVISQNHQNSLAHWQLTLKKQVVSAQHQGFVVGIFVVDDYPTNRLWVYNNDGTRHVNLKKILEYDTEPLHYRTGLKDVNESLIGKALERTRVFSKKQRISSDLFHVFVNNVFNRITPFGNAERILNGEFNMDQFRNNHELYKSEEKKYDFNSNLEMSFLPDVIAIKKDYNVNLFFVILPTKEKVSDARRIYYRKFKEYLDLNGVKCISFWDNPELNDKANFKDNTHFKDGYIKANEMLAKELVDQGIVR